MWCREEVALFKHKLVENHVMGEKATQFRKALAQQDLGSVWLPLGLEALKRSPSLSLPFPSPSLSLSFLFVHFLHNHAALFVLLTK